MDFVTVFFLGMFAWIAIWFLFFKHNSGQEQIQRTWTEIKNGKKEIHTLTQIKVNGIIVSSNETIVTSDGRTTQIQKGC